MIVIFVGRNVLFGWMKVSRVLLIPHARKSIEKNPKECFVEWDCVPPVLGSIETGPFDVAEKAPIADRNDEYPLRSGLLPLKTVAVGIWIRSLL